MGCTYRRIAAAIAPAQKVLREAQVDDAVLRAPESFGVVVEDLGPFGDGFGGVAAHDQVRVEHVSDVWSTAVVHQGTEDVQTSENYFVVVVLLVLHHPAGFERVRVQNVDDLAEVLDIFAGFREIAEHLIFEYPFDLGGHVFARWMSFHVEHDRTTEIVQEEPPDRGQRVQDGFTVAILVFGFPGGYYAALGGVGSFRSCRDVAF